MSAERPMDRRGFWRTALRGMLPSDGAKATPSPAPEPAAPAGTPFRPPGALAEAAFLETCRTGCRICVDACPRYVIIPSLETGQPGGGDGRPYLLPERAACDLCGLCMLGCPTGALDVIAREDVRIGLARIEHDACVRARGRTCTVCLDQCPYPGVAIREADGLPRIVAVTCTGCGLCAEACPPSAIRVVLRG